MFRKYKMQFFFIFIIQFFLICSFDYFSTDISVYEIIFEGTNAPLGGKIINIFYVFLVTITYSSFMIKIVKNSQFYITKHSMAKAIFNNAIVKASFISVIQLIVPFILLVILSFTPSLYLNIEFVWYIIIQSVVLFLYFNITLLVFSIYSIYQKNNTLTIIMTLMTMIGIHVINMPYRFLERILDLGDNITEISKMLNQGMTSIATLLVVNLILYFAFMKNIQNFEVYDEMD